MSTSELEISNMRELSEFEVEEINGGMSPGVVYAVRVGIVLVGLGAGGVVIGGVAAYIMYQAACN